MEQPLLVKLADHTQKIINELQICTIEQKGALTIIHMSNGEMLEIIDPPWEAWMNDWLTRRI